MRRFIVGVKRVMEFEDIVSVDADDEEQAMNEAELMARDIIDTDRPPVADECQVINVDEIPYELD